MADGGEKKGGMMGLIVPFVLVVLLGVGMGFGGFKAVGVLPPKPPAETPAAEAAPAAAAKKPEAAADAHGKEAGGDKKEALSPEEASKQARILALLAEEQKARKLELADTTMVPITPIITNLENPSTTWIRFEGMLAVNKLAQAKPADIAQSVTPRLLAYLKTLNLSDLQGATGLEFLSTDLNEIARNASKGEVHSVLITGFVVE